MLPTPYFENDGVTLYQGDCREILPELGSESFDLVVTDPPYLVSYISCWGTEWRTIQGDSDPTWVHPAFSEIWRVQKRDSLCFSFYGWPTADIFLGAWKTIGYRPVGHIALVKVRCGFGRFMRTQHAVAYLLAKGTPQKPAAPMSDVLIAEPPYPLLHPNQKALGPISQLITTYAPDVARVLDPFSGSGTTLVAARSVGRRAVGIEIEERFCEAAALRLSQQILDLPKPSEPAEQMLLIPEHTAHHLHTASGDRL
jgi:site-specific DNA-methyltransferase (adenine-specific)